jgi:hypothetical protein
MSSNIDEHVRRLPPSANEGGALLGLSRERSGGLLRWKAPRALERRRIDVLRRERARSTGKGLLRQPDPAAERGVRGRDRRGCRQPRKQRRSCSPHASAHEVWVSKGLKPAVRRQARGRWRPDDREVVRRRARRQRCHGPSSTQKPSAGGFIHGGRRLSPEGKFRRVLVT